MLEGIIGRKLGMTQVFKDNGSVIAVTAIQAGPCVVTQVKTEAKEGYNAAQVGFGEARQKKSDKEGTKERVQFKYLREFTLPDAEGIKVGDKVDVSLFKEGDMVDVIGISKSKGFAGVVKRHHFVGGPKTHGQSDRLRHPGAIGSTTSPGRIWKGLRMAGRMGGIQVTASNLEVFKADPTANVLLVKGAVPGSNKGLLMIRKASGRK